MEFNAIQKDMELLLNNDLLLKDALGASNGDTTQNIGINENLSLKNIETFNLGEIKMAS